MSTRKQSSRQRSTRRRIRGGGWNQIINQAVAPIALLGLSYVFNKRNGKRSGKRSNKHSNKTIRKR
jgi:hypothetical protein